MTSKEILSRCLEDWVLRHLPGPAQTCAAPIATYSMPEEEAALIGRAVSRRKDEFSTGRHLARAALSRLGCPVTALGMGKFRQPLWPEGTTGSISHDGGYCIAAAQHIKSGVAGIGLDLIDIPGRTSRMAEIAPLFLADEKELAAVNVISSLIMPELLVFSLKEAILKAMAGQLDRFIDLREIQLHGQTATKVRLAGELVPMRLSAEQIGPILVTLAIRLR
ncbi:4'-phosphopantetheinyl transferase superfamily protein [Labrenzia sp. PHM005]|nr:4'-phosphopantetheinyl transferase superfamily protein [Labrenzia sp. PHM005]